MFKVFIVIILLPPFMLLLGRYVKKLEEREKTAFIHILEILDRFGGSLSTRSLLGRVELSATPKKDGNNMRGISLYVDGKYKSFQQVLNADDPHRGRGTYNTGEYDLRRIDKLYRDPIRRIVKRGYREMKKQDKLNENIRSE